MPCNLRSMRVNCKRTGVPEDPVCGRALLIASLANKDAPPSSADITGRHEFLQDVVELLKSLVLQLKRPGLAPFINLDFQAKMIP